MSWRERQLEQWLQWRAVEDAVTHANRVAAPTAPEPEPEIPEAIKREERQAIDNRRAMGQALGRPSREHREFAEELRSRWGRPL